jgi:hypothetical protein
MWTRWRDLFISQRAQADQMFSGDVGIALSGAASLLTLRNYYGYWVGDNGEIVCRRVVTQIHDWQATSHLEA